MANKADQVRLFSPKNELLQTVDYSEAPADQSYSRIIIHHEDNSTEEQWLWNLEPTPNAPNPDQQEITGTIVSNPSFAETYQFDFQTSAGDTKTIEFNEQLIPGPLAKATFIKGSQAKLWTTENEDGRLKLQKYEVTSLASSLNNFSFGWFGIGAAGFIAITTTTLYFLKKLPWQKKTVLEYKKTLPYV